MAPNGQDDYDEIDYDDWVDYVLKTDEALQSALIREQGFVFHPSGRRQPTGWMVPMSGAQMAVPMSAKGQELVNRGYYADNDQLDSEVFRTFVRHVKKDLAWPDSHLSGWYDVEKAQTYFSVCRGMEREDMAAALAQANRQLAMFNIMTREYAELDKRTGRVTVKRQGQGTRSTSVVGHPKTASLHMMWLNPPRPNLWYDKFVTMVHEVWNSDA